MVNHTTLNSHKRPLLITLLILAIGLSFLTLWHSGNAQSDIPVCPAGVSLVDPVGPDISGITNFSVQIQTNSTPPVAKVVFSLGDSNIGAVTTASPDSRWVLQNYDTRGKPNGSYPYHATVQFNTSSGTTATTSSTCRTDARPINIKNTSSASGNLVLRVDPNKWSGPTNNNINFTSKTGYDNGSGVTDVSSSATYQWTTTIGSIKFTGPKATFISGPVAGKGTVTVKTSYAGQQRSGTIEIEVFTATDNNVASYPTVTSKDTPDPSSATPAKPPKQGDIELESCLKDVIGEDAYKNYATKGIRFSFENIKRSDKCFAKRRFVVPANLAPIAPDKIKDLPVAEKFAKIESFKTVTNNGQAVIQISGIGQPNNTVLVYVFSEPLVLVTQADSAGKWSYTLEDPLEAGSHEAYVTVENDKNTPVRSNAYAFGIASATKTDSNPLGLSLLTNKQDPITLYVGSGISLIAIGGLAVFITLRLKRKPQLVPWTAQTIDSSANNLQNLHETPPSPTASQITSNPMIPTTIVTESNSTPTTSASDQHPQDTNNDAQR